MHFRQRIVFIISVIFFPFVSFSQELDLGVQEAGQVISKETLFPFAKLTMICFSIYVILGISLLVFFFLKNKRTWRPPVFLENFPLTAKAAITLTAVAYSFVHVLALLEALSIAQLKFISRVAVCVKQLR